MQKINIENFALISLEETDKVKLMNRMDTKYWFHIKDLQNLLKKVEDDYFILSIGGTEKMPYSTTYYDTVKNSMFTAHHNGKLNRFKVRKRTYLSSGISFLEVKFKNNKGRTIKERILSNNPNVLFSENESEFIDKTTPFLSHELQPTLVNTFYRIMLINKGFNERCTIDFNLAFENESAKQSLDNLVVVEIKSGHCSKNLPLSKVLNSYRIKSSGFSKYCMGMAVTDKTVKRNAFKPKIRTIEKLLQTDLITV